MASYNKTYKFHTKALPGEEYWEETDQIRPVPPMIKKNIERPKKNRKKTFDEPVNLTKLKRKLRVFTYRVCEETNHNT